MCVCVCVLVLVCECVCVCVCVCNLSTEWNAHVPYFYLWPDRLCNIFPHYLIKEAIFEKKNIEHQIVCFDLLYNFCL